MLQNKALLLASHNAGKIAEVTSFLAPAGVDVMSARSLGLPEPAETEDDYVGNARIKACAAFHAMGLATIADDSGIEIDALDGAPGPRTADWAESCNGRDFKQAMMRAHRAILSRSAIPPWAARFVCVIILITAEGQELQFRGHVDGQFVWPPRGASGHGFDPVFVAKGHAKSFAQLDQRLKNRISHRAVALRAMMQAIGIPMPGSHLNRIPGDDKLANVHT